MRTEGQIREAVETLAAARVGSRGTAMTVSLVADALAWALGERSELAATLAQLKANRAVTGCRCAACSLGSALSPDRPPTG